jgi:hypothetical protein
MRSAGKTKSGTSLWLPDADAHSSSSSTCCGQHIVAFAMLLSPNRTERWLAFAMAALWVMPARETSRDAGTLAGMINATPHNDLRDTLFVQLHIPKSAGTALQSIIREHPLSPCTSESYARSRERRQPYYVDGFWKSTADAVAYTADALTHNYPNTWCQGGEINGTHASLSTLRLAAEAAGKHTVRFLTMLREPVSRTISEWIQATQLGIWYGESFLGACAENAWRRYAGSWEYQCGGWHIDAKLSLTSFLNSSAAKVGWSNRQTRMLTASGVRVSKGPSFATVLSSPTALQCPVHADGTAL